MDARWADLPKVTQDISAYLPDTQVIEKITKAQARANMRMEAAKLAEQPLKQEKLHQQSRLAQFEILYKATEKEKKLVELEQQHNLKSIEIITAQASRKQVILVFGKHMEI